MRIQVWENSRTQGILAGGTITLSTPTVRPRLEGYGGALQGSGYNSRLADKASATFHVRCDGIALADLAANLTIYQLPLTYNAPNPLDFIPVTLNVTGLIGVDGVLSVDLENFGVCYTELAIQNTAANPGRIFVVARIMGDERGIDSQSAFVDQGQT